MIYNLKEHKLTKELLLSYDLCEKLKKLNFNIGCHFFYDSAHQDVLKNYKDYRVIHKEDNLDCIEGELIICPEIDVAAEWLRKQKHIPIQMLYSKVKDEWASCVEEKYFWRDDYYYAMADGIEYALDTLLNTPY